MISLSREPQVEQLALFPNIKPKISTLMLELAINGPQALSKTEHKIVKDYLRDHPDRGILK